MRPLLTNSALEEIVAEEPYDDDGWSVLEDWLLEQDDPRAEILRSADPEKARQPLLPLLLPGLPSKGLDWRGGYVTEAMFYAEDCQRLFEQFVKAPAATLLRTLSIATGLPELRGAYAALATAPFARSLRLLQLTSDESGELPAGVLDKLQRLNTLMLERVVLDTTDAAVFARLGTLSIAPSAERDLVAFLCARPLPALQTLRLDFRNLEASVRVPELAPLWEGAITPRVRHLIVRDREPVTAKLLLGVLAASELTPRLRELTLGDVACKPEALLGFGTAFHHLEKLSLPDDVRRFHNQPF